MPQAKPKLKIQTNNKCYEIHDSCLFKLSSKKKLAQLLGIELSELKIFTEDANYNCFIDNSKGKPREIQHPKPRLEKIHTRIASLLCRIRQPNYVHSGIKGRSHITNAKIHIGSHPVLTSDIQSFFPNTTRQMVFDFFSKHMQCSPDIADLLSKICTYNDHIPTGSRISMPLAFWANIPMFDLLQKNAEQKQITFTVFVDDLTFSGQGISPRFTSQVKKIISEFGHKAHPKKTKLYKSEEIKLITGVAVTDTGIHVANKHLKKIYQDFVEWKALYISGYQIPSVNQRILGRLNAQALIEPGYKDKVRSLNQLISLQ